MGATMRWNFDLPEIPAVWRQGACALTLLLAGCASGTDEAPPSPAPSIVGLWVAEEVAGAPVPADAHVTLSLYDDGRAVGRAACNNYTTKYKRDGGSISFGPMISTKMACTPELMSLEQSYLEALTAATVVDRRPDGTLVLTAGNGAPTLFRREEAASLKDARARGVDFRAAGQEPGWVVELKEGGEITAVLDYGAKSLTLPTPSAATAEDGTVTYDSSTDTDHLVLNIKRKICLDAMSGEAHSSTVELLVNERSLRGCGDWLR
jgi:heat shock protein HslJ